jgi:hypothetical protein
MLLNSYFRFETPFLISSIKGFAKLVIPSDTHMMVVQGRICVNISLEFIIEECKYYFFWIHMLKGVKNLTT